MKKFNPEIHGAMLRNIRDGLGAEFNVVPDKELYQLWYELADLIADELDTRKQGTEFYEALGREIKEVTCNFTVLEQST
jgi:hypothetical protein